MHFAMVAWCSFRAKVNNMANIQGRNVMFFLSIRLEYLMKKTGTFLKRLKITGTKVSYGSVEYPDPGTVVDRLAMNSLLLFTVGSKY